MLWFLSCSAPPTVPEPPTGALPSARERLDPYVATNRPPHRAANRSIRLDGAPVSDWGPPLTADTLPPPRPGTWSLVALEGGRWALLTQAVDPGTHIYDPAEGRIASWERGTGSVTPDGSWWLARRRHGSRPRPAGSLRTPRSNVAPVRLRGVPVMGAHQRRTGVDRRLVWSDLALATVPLDLNRESRQRGADEDFVGPWGRIRVRPGEDETPSVRLVPFDDVGGPTVTLDGCLSPGQTWWSGDSGTLGCLTPDGASVFRADGSPVARWDHVQRDFTPVSASLAYDGAGIVLGSATGDVAYWAPERDEGWRVDLAPGTQAILTDDGSLVVATLAGAFALYDAQTGERLDDPTRSVAWAESSADVQAGLDGSVWRGRHRFDAGDSPVARGCEVDPRVVRFGEPSVRIETLFWLGDTLHISDGTTVLAKPEDGRWSRVASAAPPTRASLTRHAEAWQLTLPGKDATPAPPLPLGTAASASDDGRVLTVADEGAWWVGVGGESPRRVLGVRKGAELVAVDPAGARVAGITRRGELHVWTEADRTVTRWGDVTYFRARHMAWSDDGRALAVAHEMGLDVWRDGVRVSAGGAEPAVRLAVDPDGCTIAWTVGTALWAWDEMQDALHPVASHVAAESHQIRDLVAVGGVVELSTSPGGRLRWSEDGVASSVTPWNRVDRVAVDDEGQVAIVEDGGAVWTLSSQSTPVPREADGVPSTHGSVGERSVVTVRGATIVQDEGRLRCVLPGARMASLSPSGRYVAVLTGVGRALVADVETCRATARMEQVVGRSLHDPARANQENPVHCASWGCTLGRDPATGATLGHHVTLLAQSAAGTWAVLRRNIDEQVWRVEPPMQGPALAPDPDEPTGRSVAVRDDGVTAWVGKGRLWWVDPKDGTVREIPEVPAPRALAWHPTGLLVAANTGEVHLLEVAP